MVLGQVSILFLQIPIDYLLLIMNKCMLIEIVKFYVVDA